MDPSAQAEPEYYIWELPEKPLSVHLHFDVIDRLLSEVMRGFGAVPKRGAEVGGLLLGSIAQGAQTVVKIDDFVPIQCDYKRGPSYLFTANDAAAFEDARVTWQPGPSRPTYAVGYFRSHTRDGLALGSEDVELMEQYFPSPSHVALLVKPFATKASSASFFFRDQGRFQPDAPFEFPFRRRELTGEEAPPRRSMLERVPRRREEQPEPAAPVPEPMRDPVRDPAPAPASPSYAYASPSKSRPRGGWVWIPLSFVFLLLGVVLGFQAALTMGPRTGSGGEYALGLTVTKDGNNLSVKWDRDAPAVRAAQKGVLEIEDGGFSKPVDLDAAQLRNGSIIFTNSSKNVRFQLTVYPQARVSITQTMVWDGKGQ
jgi:hypothetical protein